MDDDHGGGGGGGGGGDGGVCERCELRASNVREARRYEHVAADGLSPLPTCGVCLGVLQRAALAAVAQAARAQMDALKHARAYRIAASLPLSAVLLRERAFLLGRRAHRVFSMRDALRAALRPLMMPLRYDAEAEVVFRLFYEHRETAGEGDFLRESCGGVGGGSGAGKRARADVSITAAQKVLDGMSDKEFEVAAPHLMQLPPVAQPVSVSVRVETVPLLLAARYTKLSRVVSQTPWNVASSRTVNGRVERSVQSVVERAVRQVILHERATFTAGGREDVDVRMLGDGRPFVLELQGANVVPSLVDARMIDDIVARIDGGVVRVHGLRVVPSTYFAKMRQYEAEKRKHYRCVIYTEGVLDEHNLQLLNMQNVSIAQRTPLRVLHRRTQAVRHKMIFSTHVQRVMNEHFVVLDVIAQAGTYIKEFVHGDNGRTSPSVASLLQCFADIVQLDVTEISQAS